MVVRTWLRSILLSLCLVALCGSGSWYFVRSANSGVRGLKTQSEYEAKAASLNEALASLVRERKAWEQRIALMRDDHVDKDLLEEEARLILGRVHKNDVVIFLSQPAVR